MPLLTWPSQSTCSFQWSEMLVWATHDFRHVCFYCMVVKGTPQHTGLVRVNLSIVACTQVANPVYLKLWWSKAICICIWSQQNFCRLNGNFSTPIGLWVVCWRYPVFDHPPFKKVLGKASSKPGAPSLNSSSGAPKVAKKDRRQAISPLAPDHLLPDGVE